MPSLKDLRNRIASVKSTQKITRAMQMVAAAKLKKAQSAAEAARPYSLRMERVLANLAGNMKDKPGAPPLLVGNGKDDVHLLLVITADRGLAGAFNSSIVRLARLEIDTLLRAGKRVKLFTVGRKARDMLRRLHRDKIIESLELVHMKGTGFMRAAHIGARIRELFENGEFDICTLYYSRFAGVMSQAPTAQRLIPASIPKDTPDITALLGGAIYEYEPDEEEILAGLLPLNLNAQIFKALLENAAGEEGARMTAMDSATRNASEMIDALTLKYNRTRQAVITKELIEIISGAEAL